ncbi:MAG: hypothetical protein US70_C0008G0019 [Parcubacteria group bacterium GW2011_GWD2_38_11]|nr:MAG: hypothetical protein US70_C0008G0019 [Parcubacteria group bacterium GW2011_GWD2_38_11]
MKKFLVSFVFVFLLVPMAQAFTVPEEVQVVPSPNTTAVYPEVSPSFTIGDVKKAVNRGVGSVNKKIAALNAEIIKKDTATAKSVDALGQKIDGQTGEIKKVGDGVKSLDNKLTGKNGEFEKSRNTMWSVGKELSDSIALYLVIAAVVIILLGLVCFVLLKKTLSRVEDKVDNIDVKIDDVPDLTAAAVKTLDHIIIELKDVVGRNVTYIPSIVNGMYVSIYVPKTVTLAPADPAQIVRAQMSDKGKLRRSTREVMTEYYNGAFDGADFHSVEQKRLILHLISTGEIVVA